MMSNVPFPSHSTHICHIFSMHFFQFKMMLYDFLAISIWKAFGSKMHRTLYLNVSLITASGVRSGDHLLKRVSRSDTFRSHVYKFLSAASKIFVLLRYNFLSLRPF